MKIKEFCTLNIDTGWYSIIVQKDNSKNGKRFYTYQDLQKDKTFSECEIIKINFTSSKGLKIIVK